VATLPDLALTDQPFPGEFAARQQEDQSEDERGGDESTAMLSEKA